MKNSNLENKSILDKLYNLRGDDSVILVKMKKEKDLAEETKIKTEREKTLLQENLTKLRDDESLLQDEGEALKRVLSSIRNDDFAVVLERLKISFNPEEINRKLDASLPEAVEKIAKEKEEAELRLENVDKMMKDAITTMDELSLRKDEALSNQQRLNEIFNLALNGNINITREEITSLLFKLGFNEEESREAAKILMFPEDGLYEYDKKGIDPIKNGKSMAEVFAEAKDYEEVTPKVESIPVKIEEAKPLFEEISLEEELEEPKEDKDSVKELLNKNGFDALNFTSKDLDYLLDNYNKEVMEKNIDMINKLGIDKDIFNENMELFVDKELGKKIESLMKIGKVPFDIYLNPNILIKYNYEELNKAIETLKESGLDPKKVPLMAF